MASETKGILIGKGDLKRGANGRIFGYLQEQVREGKEEKEYRY